MKIIIAGSGKAGPAAAIALFLTFASLCIVTPSILRVMLGKTRGPDFRLGSDSQFIAQFKPRDAAKTGTFGTVREILADGTIVTTTYGHWDPSQQPYIRAVRLTLAELDERASRIGPGVYSLQTGMDPAQVRIAWRLSEPSAATMASPKACRSAGMAAPARALNQRHGHCSTGRLLRSRTFSVRLRRTLASCTAWATMVNVRSRDCTVTDAPALACLFKQAFVHSFLDQRIGWVSLAAGVFAFVRGSRGLAWAGWLKSQTASPKPSASTWACNQAWSSTTP